jgi:prevent-host-death family protein
MKSIDDQAMREIFSMKELISIREANQHLSRYVDAIQDGGEIVITRRGKPVARLIDIKEVNGLTRAQKDARNRTLVRMHGWYSLGGHVIQRDALHVRQTAESGQQ